MKRGDTMRKLIAVLALLVAFVAGCIDEGEIYKRIDETSEILMVEVTDSCTQVCSTLVNEEMSRQEEKIETIVDDNIAELENKFAEYLILYQQMRQQEQEQGCLTEDQIYCILWEHYQFAKGNNLTYTFGCFDPS